MDVFAAIADPVRRDLLRTLSTGDARVVDLAQGRSISRPAVSKHLRLLTEAGLVSAQDVGRERHYRVRPGALAEVAAFIAQITSTGQPPVTSSMLDALDLEVRRVGRDRVSGDHADRAADPTGQPHPPDQPHPTDQPHPRESA